MTTAVMRAQECAEYVIFTYFTRRLWTVQEPITMTIVRTGCAEFVILMIPM